MCRARGIIREPTPLPDTKLLVVLRSGKQLHSYNTIMSLTILDLERSLPLCLRDRLQSGVMKTLCLPTGNRTCYR
ncbi:unnamed protein product [Arctogadus glacialis]